MIASIPDQRIERLPHSKDFVEEGDYVLYWMVAHRRTRWNYSLQHAIRLAQEHNKGLIVFEALFQTTCLTIVGAHCYCTVALVITAICFCCFACCARKLRMSQSDRKRHNTYRQVNGFVTIRQDAHHHAHFKSFKKPAPTTATPASSTSLCKKARSRSEQITIASSLVPSLRRASRKIIKMASGGLPGSLQGGTERR